MTVLNTQPKERQTLSDRGLLEVHHVFPTIQGEGPFAGKPAVFVRLTGCNLQCPFCDTDYTSRRDLMAPDELVHRVQKVASPSRLVVITGGEPFRQNLTPAVNALFEAGFQVQVETNGTLYLEKFPYGVATIVCSPKTNKINKHLFPYIDALKYVLEDGMVDEEDGLPIKALNHPATRVARPPEWFMGTIYVQPLDVGNTIENQHHLDVAISSAVKFGYTLCVQTHKIIGLE